jgi:hypothetical protein
MENRPTLEQFGPIVAKLPADWPEKGAKLPRRERVAVVPSLDDLAAVAVMEPVRKAQPKEEEDFEEQPVRDEAPVGLADEDADLAVGAVATVEPEKAAVVASEMMAVTSSDKLEGLLDTLPDEIVRFVEDEMRARFVGVKVV